MIKKRYSKQKLIKITGIVLLFIFVLMILTNTTFRRYVTLGMADVYDFDHLPVANIEERESNFLFIETPKNKEFENFIYNGKTIEYFGEFLERNKTTAFIVIQNDSILYENYFNGHHKDSLCKIFSITKNVLSTLIGIAIDKGQIDNLHDPIIQYIPELKNKGLDEITIYHCLNGTAGLKYNKYYLPFSDEAKMYYRPNVRNLLLNLKLENEPGTVFRTENYSPLLLGWLLEKVTENSVTNYLQKNLWQPIGMSNGKIVIDSKKHMFEKVESGLVIRPIDLVKIGRLWLNNGKWEGKQIVSADWIKSSINLEKNEKHNVFWESENQKEFYKHMWWGFSTNNQTTKYSANGHFGQRLVIIPDKKMVILRLGTASGEVKWGSFISQLIKHIEQENGTS